MKKVLAISSVLLVTVFLAGCGQQPVSQTQTPAPVARQPITPVPVARQPITPVDKTASLEDSVALNIEQGAEKIGSRLDDYLLINYGGVKVDVFVDWPENDTKDILVSYHGTTMDDSKTALASKDLAEKIRNIIDRKDIMIISVAYPEENLLIGDNIKEAEAALLWTKNKASEELGIKINKIYLFGHSLGGYLVTRLNTMHKTDGVIANGPGPLDLSFRCSIIEKNKMKGTEEELACSSIYEKYGSVFENPIAYEDRSLTNFTSGYTSRSLFIQGLNDKKIQMKSWPIFKERISQCTDCAEYDFLEIENAGHHAVFESEEAIDAVNIFLR